MEGIAQRNRVSILKTQILYPDEAKQAATILCRGGLVAIPTETVYGLGAHGLNPEAVQRIFYAKGRPQDNPLILHVPDETWLEDYCLDIPEAAWVLARQFWPGPLTIILKRRNLVPDVVTGGLNTVGMRCPAHPVARSVIQAAEVPIAAPSANASGRPSPTTAAHVLEDLDGKIDAVLDGGPCTVGVESTIVDVTVSPPRLLRPGGITLEKLKSVLGELAVDPAVVRPMRVGEIPRAPGMKYRHYAPQAPVTVVRGKPECTAPYIRNRLGPRSGVICFREFSSLFSGYMVEELGSVGDKREQARHIFDALRAFDATDVTDIWAQSPDEEGIGLAVSNRLNKAAGFHIIHLEA